MYFKENKGVTLLALTITIIVMLIITSTIIYNTNIHVRTEKINKLYNDIENISNKIEDYYLKYGEIPTIGNVYCDKTGLNYLLSNNANAQNATLKTINDVMINPNDGDEYYIIDLEKLEGLTLNYGYGDDYKTAKNTPDSITTDLDEVYIINKATHQIYYPSGVFADDFMYYSYSLDTNEAINEYNISSKDNTDNIISFNNENVVNVNSLKVYGNSIQNGEPAPDNPVEIESVGDLVTDTSDDHYREYKVPVTVSGKNLFNISKVISSQLVVNNGDNTLSITPSSSSSGVSANGANTLKDYAPSLQVGKTYTLSAKTTGTGKHIYLVTSKYIWYFGKSKTITEDDLNSTVCWYANGVDTTFTATVSDIQIEEISATEYEPYFEPVTSYIYLKEPLRKLGDNYADYIDLKTGKVVRNIGKYEITGKESWSKYDTYNTYYMLNTISAKYEKDINCFCNRYQGQVSASGKSYSSGNAWIQSTSTYRRFYLSDDNYSTVSEFKTYLSEQYTNGTPIEIEYVLDTPTEETIELPTISMYEGTNIITVNTGLQPSNIELNYYEINK